MIIEGEPEPDSLPHDTEVTVRDRGKAYIAFKSLTRVKLPSDVCSRSIPLLIYEGEPYIPVEYAEELVRRPKTPWTGEGKAVYPTIETVRVTCGTHRISKSFVTDFLVTRGEDGEWRCKEKDFIRRHIFVHLYRFAAFAHKANWNPTVFATWNQEQESIWKLAVIMSADLLRPSLEAMKWKEKAFCSPTGEFLGRKPGNKLTYDEMYRFGERKATRQKKKRRDCITMPWEKEEDRKKRYGEGRKSITISYEEGMRVVVNEEKREIKIMQL